MITASRVRKGTLTFDGASTIDPNDSTKTTFACQTTSIKVTPTVDGGGDQTETLCGDVISDEGKETWKLSGSAIQDFDDPYGFLAYCYENAGKTVPFEWKPNTVGSPTWTGRVKIVALEEGGDVNTQLTTDWEFEATGVDGSANPARPLRTAA